MDAGIEKRDAGILPLVRWSRHLQWLPLSYKTVTETT
jgi:hypothetical protein